MYPMVKLFRHGVYQEDFEGDRTAGRLQKETFINNRNLESFTVIHVREMSRHNVRTLKGAAGSKGKGTLGARVSLRKRK